MSFQIGDRVLLTENSEWASQNIKNGRETVGEVIGRYVNGEFEGKFEPSFKHFKYAVIWPEKDDEDELYYRDKDLKYAEALPVTNQDAKKFLSKEW